MRKLNLEGDQKVDYIHCLAYVDFKAVQPNFEPIEVTDTTVSCNLSQRQRSSQQILDLADYLQMHYKHPIRRYEAPKSFSSDIIPLWIELDNPNAFFALDIWLCDYFKYKFECDDVMLIHQRPPNLNDIEECCREQKWRCASSHNVKGSEASATILYDFDDFVIEYFTRAKTQLIIVTIDEKQRYSKY